MSWMENKTLKLSHSEKRAFVTIWQTSRGRQEVLQRLTDSPHFPDDVGLVYYNSPGRVPFSDAWLRARVRMLARYDGVTLKELPWSQESVRAQKERALEAAFRRVELQQLAVELL